MAAPYKYTPEQLTKKIEEYYIYIESNPIKKVKTESNSKDTKTYIEYIQRPYTIEGLSEFLNVTHKTFNNWENNPLLLPIVIRAKQKIRQNKMEGAVAGIYNANIIIRDLSLRDTDTPQIINNIIPLNSNEVKAIAQSLANDYGKLPEKKPIEIDITPEEND